jgi:hypothetical protein
MNLGFAEAGEMAVSNENACICTDCGVKINGVPVVPAADEGPTQAQIEKLKPTIYLCTECAADRGLSFEGMTIGRPGQGTPPPAP